MIPGFLVQPAIGAALLAVAAAGGWGWLKLSHDPAIRAEVVAEITAATQAAQLEAEAKNRRALEDMAAELRMKDMDLAATREAVRRAPVTKSCMASPAMRAALAGVRKSRSGAGKAGGPGKSPGLSAGAGTAE
jgi:hypothetical protein